jgi:hypothetical protein
MELKKITPSDFPFIYNEMEKSFVKEEIRDFDDAKEVLENPLYEIFHISEKNENVGFITLWKLSEFYFVEHFVIFEKHRNCGFGKKAIELVCTKYEKVFLEAEPPCTDIASRRIKFYERCGFVQNGFPYMQPSYRKGGNGVELVILSYKERLSQPESTIEELYNKVYGVKG